MYYEWNLRLCTVYTDPLLQSLFTVIAKKKYCCLKFLDISSQVEGFSIIDISVYILLLKICLVSLHMQMCCAYRCPHTYTHELCLC